MSEATSTSTTSGNDPKTTTLYAPVEIGSGGNAEMLGQPTEDKKKAQKIADTTPEGEVMRLVADDFIDQGVEAIIHDNVKESRGENTDDLIPVPREAADSGKILAETEVEKIENEPREHPQASVSVWKKTRDALQNAITNY